MIQIEADNVVQDTLNVVKASRDENGMIDENKLMIGLVIYITKHDMKIRSHAFSRGWDLGKDAGVTETRAAQIGSKTQTA